MSPHAYLSLLMRRLFLLLQASFILWLVQCGAEKSEWLKQSGPAGCDIDVMDAADPTSVATFKRDYDGKAPVLIRGAAAAWPAHARWSKSYLAERFGDFKFSAKKPSDDPECAPPGSLGESEAVTMATFLAQMQSERGQSDQCKAPPRTCTP